MVTEAIGGDTKALSLRQPAAEKNNGMQSMIYHTPSNQLRDKQFLLSLTHLK